MPKGQKGWLPGESGNPSGRPPGVPNKATTRIREQYVKLIEDNLPLLQKWLERVAKDDPKGAMEMMLKISPFIMPKLTQTDITSDGEAIQPVNIILPKP